MPAKQSFPSYFIIFLLLMCSFELQSHTLIPHRSLSVHITFQCMNGLIKSNFFEIFRDCMHKLVDSSETMCRIKKNRKIHDHLSKYFMQILLPQIEMIRLSAGFFFPHALLIWVLMFQLLYLAVKMRKYFEWLRSARRRERFYWLFRKKFFFLFQFIICSFCSIFKIFLEST